MAIKDDAKELDGILGKIKNAMADVDSYFDKGSKSLSSLVDIASQFNDYQNRTVKLNSEQLTQLSKKLQLEKENLHSSQESLARSIQRNAKDRDNLKTQLQSIQNTKKNKDVIKDLNDQLKNVIKDLDKELELHDYINAALNDTNKQVENLEKSLNKAAKNEALSENLDKLSNKAGNLGSILGVSLSFSGLLDILTSVDKAIGDFSKSMNMTYADSTKLSAEYTKIAEASGDNALNANRMLETQAAIGAALGTNAKINEADLKTFTKLREQAGYTNEELMGIQQLSLLNGKSLEKNTSEILGGAKAYAARNKIVVNEKQVLKEVSKASAALKLSLGGSTKAIAESVVKAKQFGLTLEQTEKMSQSLLNFEDSIESELSAELLTGKDLNLERARGLALNGQTAEAAAEIAAQVGSSAEFGRMNVIQQEAIAKAVGMERNELAQSLIDREALAKIGFKDAEAAKAKYDLLRQTMSVEEAAKALGDEDLARQYEQQSVQESFNDAMEKLKVTLANDLLPMFQSIGEFITKHLSMIKLIAGIYLGMKTTMFAMNLLNAAGLAIDRKRKKTAEKEAGNEIVGSAFKMSAALGPLGIAVAAGIIATGLASLAMFSGDDVLSPAPGGSGYGKRTLFGPEGAIKLNDKDTVIAGTNLFGDDVTSTSTNTQRSPKGSIKLAGNGDMSAVVNAISELRRDINALANRPINVSISGKKVTEAIYDDPNTVGDESRKKSYRI
jgi:hypothetical protein